MLYLFTRGVGREVNGMGGEGDRSCFPCNQNVSGLWLDVEEETTASND